MVTKRNNVQIKAVKLIQRVLAALLSRPVSIYYRDEPMMALYVTSSCQLSCQECIMSHLMEKASQYQMDIEEVKLLIHYSELSKYKFHYRLTGGEPLLWKHLLEGVRLLRLSDSCMSISIISNAINIDAVTNELVEMVDCIRVSRYLYNTKNIALLRKKYPHKILVAGKEKFIKNPLEKVAKALPVECNNPELMFYNNKVYACPHSKSISIQAGVSMIQSNDIGENFKEGLDRIRHNMEEELCSRCISNTPVRKAMEKILNISGSNPNPERLAKWYKPHFRFK